MSLRYRIVFGIVLIRELLIKTGSILKAASCHMMENQRDLYFQMFVNYARNDILVKQSFL